MAEVLGSVSAVAGLLSFGITTCHGMISYYESVRGQRDDIYQMCSSLDSLNCVLTKILSILPRINQKEGTVTIVKQGVAKCSQGFKALEKKLEKIRQCQDDGTLISQLLRAKKKATYPLKESTILKLREVCDDLRDNLSLAINVLQMRRLTFRRDMLVTGEQRLNAITDISWRTSKMVYETAGSIRTLEKKQNAVDPSAIHSWLSPLTEVFQNRHSEAMSVKARQSNGAQKLLDSDTFKRWEDSLGAILWCQGPPGVGKTVNTAQIATALQEKCNGQEVAIAYLYFSYKDASLQNPVHIIASILQQLVLQRPQLFTHLELLHSQYSARNARPSADEIISILLHVLPEFSKVFVLIDALDELSELDEIRSIVLEQLKRLQPQVSLLIMSRPLPDLNAFFENSTQVSISADSSDIESYVRERLKTTKIMQKHLSEEPALESMIITNILNKSNGMFLMVRLYLDTLAHKTTRRKIKNALEVLPVGLDSLYEELMTRITINSPKDHAELALSVLKWIFFTHRPLAVIELQHALATEDGDHDLDQDGITDRDLLVTVCAGMVVINATSDTMSLVHYTTEEYFQRSGKRLLKNPHQDIATTCLTYFQFYKIAEFFPKLTNQTQLLQLVGQYPLLQYAAQYWGMHLRESGNKAAITHAANVLKDADLVQAVSGIKDYVESSEAGIFFRRRTEVTGLMLACSFGLTEAASMLIDGGSCVNSTDSNGQAALHYVARGGFTDTALVIVDAEADVNKTDLVGSSPLHQASSKSQAGIVKALLERGADINQVDGYNATPLYRAAEAGAIEVVRLLLTSDANFQVGNSYQQTPLHRAADAGHVEIVEMLLKKGADVNTKDYYGYTALYRALDQCHEETAELLRRYMIETQPVRKQD